MTLIILDPNLEGEAGHHLAYDLAIAKEAIARGEAATIIAHRRFAATTIEGVRILPHFTETTYAVRSTDPVTGRLDDYRAFNDLLQDELAALPRGDFRPTDCVLVPTTTENHLAGFLGWMKGFDPIEAPLFVVHLMFPSGVAVDAGGESAVEDPLRALFYRLADRIAQEAGPPVHIFASGGQHAAEFSALLCRKVAPHPLPIRPEPGSAVPAQRALLFAGDARIDKGVALLPALLPRLAGAHPEWRFAAHVNGASAWGEARAATEALAALPPGAPNIEVATGRLAPGAYLDLLRGARIALFPYDPVLYRRKSSGVLWEAISLGLPVVVPAGTWLEHEARHWGAGHVTYAAHGVDGIAGAFAEALPRIAALEAASVAAGLRFRAANGAAALVDQVAALWVRHKATATLVRRAQHATIDLLRLEAGWHRPETVDGRQVRWTAQEPVIAFDWPFDEPWEVEVTLLSFFGADQLDRCEAVAGTGPATLSSTRIGRGARLVVQGPGPGRAQPRVTLKLRLPFTYRPANEARDLGVLVAGLRVGPVAQDAAARLARPQDGPVARVLSAAAAGGGWPVAPAVSGDVVADAATPCVVALRFAAAQVPAIRGLAFYVNAVPVPLVVSAEGKGWLATATLPPALLRQGTPLAWDLVGGAADGPVPVLVAAGAAPMAGTAAGVALSAALPPEPVTAAEPAAAPPGERRIRWDLCAGIGAEEGPFEELGIPAGVRWIVARSARLVVESPQDGPARLVLRYRSLLPSQEIGAALNGDAPVALAAAGSGLREAHVLAIDLVLRAGLNELRLDFSGAVREPGTGRELVMLVEDAALD
ncbi:hypothetical protein [Roseomonas sp. CECT 9278]|uniref:hypothetical protein n=1 Tax=Roseomonas sp. CECT 9278 TaxID=2845823 RepID=UPI001E5FE234|nr:hypothetical protein [Roseomonas sp. CECT 9278]CAH0231028.1 hypothetical protein ROS9278_02651 [Roseomonas sp. CECT 9278]